MVPTLLTLITLSLLAWLGWRLYSSRQSLPCPSWLGWMVEMENPFTSICRSGTILQHSEISSGMKVLDAGCGPGRVTIPVAKRVGPNGSIVAMDLQEKMLSKVREKARSAHLSNIEFVQGGIGESRLPKETFDRILLVTVLGEIPDQENALKELFAALKSEGKLSITETIFDPHFQTQNKVRQLAKSLGFVEEAVYGSKLNYTMVLKK